MTSPYEIVPTTRNQDDSTDDQYLASNFEGGLIDSEIFWRDHQEWLKERGYMLRPRWRPGWVPSWVKSTPGPEHVKRYMFEDGERPLAPSRMMDAKRIADGEIVVLKRVKVRDSSLGEQPELKMGPMFRTEPYASDPRNHCIPIYEVLTVPDVDNLVLLVMPFLLDWSRPPFETVGEALEFCRQMFQGLQFLHENNIAHNDIKPNNIMMDHRPLFDVTLHPTARYHTYDWKEISLTTHKSRTRRPVKYYYIDFDVCEKYEPSTGPARRQDAFGGDNTVPEYWKNPGQPYDPFAVDVYRIGNVIREKISGGAPAYPFDATNTKYKPLKPSFAFLQPLISDMTQDDPTQRPTMDQVVSRFNHLISGLGTWKLRSPIVIHDGSRLSRVFSLSAHWVRQVYYMATRVPAIPTPKTK